MIARPLLSLCILTLAVLATLVRVPGQDRSAADARPRVVVVPIHGEIDNATVRLVNRGVSRAREINAERVVLDIDTPGGRIDVMQRIETAIHALREGKVRTTAWISRHALSAGGYLALACDEIAMAKEATIGAITPVLGGPDGTIQIPEDDVRRKALSSMRAEVRKLVERRGEVGRDLVFLAEAMVDPTLGRIFEVQVEDAQHMQRTVLVDEGGLPALAAGGGRIVDQVEIGRAPLTLTAVEALRRGLSGGTFASLEEMAREQLGVPSSAIERLEPSWSETAVAWLEAIKPLLFIFGFMMLLLELKLPGFGIPGILGILLVGLALFSSYLMGLAELTEILLFFLGLALIGVEVFVLPGSIAFGAAGLVAVVFSLILSQQSFIIPSDASQAEILTGNLLDLLWMILIVTAGSMTLFRFLPRIPIFNRAMLQPPEAPRTGESTRFADDAHPAAALVGVVGVALTDLRPAGVLELGDGSRHDVVSQGAFLVRGTRLRVLSVTGNRIVVEPETHARGAEGGEASLGLLFLLFAIGLALTVAEVFLVSAGALAVGAGVAMVTTIFLAFTQHGMAIGFLFLTAAVIAVPAVISLSLRTLPKTALGKKLILSGPDHESVRGAAADAALNALVGRHGITTSMLRPSGFAEIDGRRIDVVTRGEIVEVNTAIRVLAVDGNRVVVTSEAAAAP
ncbi:MAG: NfeD family protein [Planctomycetota bacterium]